MSRAHDKRVEDAGPPATEPEGQPPGKVVVDSRGHNVWQWAKDVIENTSVLLKRLENKDLELEPTRKVPILPGQKSVDNGVDSKGAKAAEKGADRKAAKPVDSNAKAAKEAATKSAAWHPAMKADQGRDRGGGFDPYNSR